MIDSRIDRELVLNGTEDEIITSALIIPYVVGGFGENDVFVSINGLELAYGIKFTKTNLAHIKPVLDKKCKKIISNRGWHFAKDQFLIGTNFLTYNPEVIKIMCQNKKINLIPYYLRVIASVNWQTNVGHMAQEFFCRNYNMNRVTISSYNKQLEKMNLLYIVHASGLSEECNYYGKPENKKQIDLAAKNLVRRNAKQTLHQSLAMKYKEVVKGHKYSNYEMFSIAEYVKNKNLHEKEKSMNDSKYIPSYLDETPLAEYIELLNSDL